MNITPISTDSCAGARLRMVGDTVRVLADGGSTNGAYEIFELEGPRGSGPAPHAHPWAEACVITAGEVEIVIGGRSMRATSGAFFNVPAGTTHCYRIVSESAKLVIVTSPAGAGELFSELDRETGGPAEDFDAIVRAALSRGFAVPPPRLSV